jgi:hypothetical protein
LRPGKYAIYDYLTVMEKHHTKRNIAEQKHDPKAERAALHFKDSCVS